MKRICAVLLAGVLILGLCACQRGGESVEESLPGAASSGENSSSGDGAETPEGPEETEAPWTAVRTWESDEELVREIIKDYGGEIVTQKDGIPRLRRKNISLFDMRYSWEDPREIPANFYYIWFFSTTLGEGEAYRQEHYSHPKGENSWFYPQEVFEERVQSRFDVPTEFLRWGSEYDPELKGYWLRENEGCGSDPAEISYSFKRNSGDRIIIDLELDYQWGTILADRFQLAVELDGKGGWTYKRCDSFPREVPTAGYTRQEAEQYLPLTAEQWELFDHAEELVRMFNISTSLVLGDDLVSYSDEMREINGVTYQIAKGERYQEWADFEAEMLSVFTPEFFQELNTWVLPGAECQKIFTEYEGDIYYQLGDRGTNLCYLGEQDQYYGQVAGDVVILTRYAYYRDIALDWSESNPAAQVRAIPVIMKNTKDGWRVDYFKLPY